MEATMARESSPMLNGTPLQSADSTTVTSSTSATETELTVTAIEVSNEEIETVAPQQEEEVSEITRVEVSIEEDETALQRGEKKRIGIVLAGGGAKGVAHIGVLKVLEEAGLPIDYIAGTSMGSLIGALYSIGYNAHEMDSIVRVQDWTTLLSDKIQWKDKTLFARLYGNVYTLSLSFTPQSKESSLLPAGLVKGQNINNLFSDLTIGYQSPMRFDSLPIPFACVATDLSAGKAYIFREGVLQEAMRASMSIPGVFTPVMLNDTLMLVDGGLVDNYPVDIVKEMGADITIGVDLDNGFKSSDKIITLIDVVDQMIELLGYDTYITNREELDISIHPDLTGYSTSSFTAVAVDSMIALGERAAREHWDDIMRLKRAAGYADDEDASPKIPHRNSTENIIPINEILLEGCDARDSRWIRNVLSLSDNSLISSAKIQKGVDKLYATGMFTQVSYRIERDGLNDGQFNLIFTMTPRPTGSLNFGIRFDTEVYTSLLLNTTLKTKRLRPLSLSISARLGLNPWGELDLLFGNTISHSFDLGYRVGYNDFYVYSGGKRLTSTVFIQHHAFINVANLSYKNLNFMAGLAYDYFQYHNMSAVSDLLQNSSFKTDGYATVNGSLTFDNMDNNIFPTRGLSMRVAYQMLTTNLMTLDSDSPAHILTYEYREIIPLGGAWHIIPQISGRTIMGHEISGRIPFSYMNAAGGVETGRYLPQQIEFPGIRNVEIFDNSITKCGLMVETRFNRKNYVSGGGHYLLQSSNFVDSFKEKGIWGMDLKYSYNTYFGPISATIATSDLRWKIAIYLSAGFYF